MHPKLQSTCFFFNVLCYANPTSFNKFGEWLKIKIFTESAKSATQETSSSSIIFWVSESMWLFQVKFMFFGPNREQQNWWKFGISDPMNSYHSSSRKIWKLVWYILTPFLEEGKISVIGKKVSNSFIAIIGTYHLTDNKIKW